MNFFTKLKMFYSVEVLAEGFFTITDGFKLKGVEFIRCFFPPLHVCLLVSFTLIYLFFPSSTQNCLVPVKLPALMS